MRQARLPKYSLHRATGQARVYIDGRDHYLGPFGSPESKERYRSLVNAWQLRRRTRCPASMAVGELVLLYDGHVRRYYVKNGKPTSEASLVRAALRPLVGRHAGTPVLDFGPRDLKAVREEFVAADLARSTANAYTRRIVALFRWGVSEEYVPSDVLAALEAVPAIRKGRTAAREAVPVTPVAEDQVNAVLPYLSRQVRDMVRLQLLTGCRPGEVCAIRPCDVDRSGEVWEYRPASHKTEHHGKGRTILLGPRAQAVLAPYLDTRPVDAWCFSPAEAEATRHVERHAKRVTPVSCGNGPQPPRGRRKRAPGPKYSGAAYGKSVERGCDAAGVPRWRPNRLRHARATDLRRRFGVETARTVLGHSRLGVTELYAERDLGLARDAMADAG